MKVDLYAEAHVTIEPVFDERLVTATAIAVTHKFRMADLLLQKRFADTPERSKHDSFMTGRSSDIADLTLRTMELVEQLRREGFKVWRYKIENTLVDSKLADELGLLGD